MFASVGSCLGGGGSSRAEGGSTRGAKLEFNMYNGRHHRHIRKKRLVYSR